MKRHWKIVAVLGMVCMCTVVAYLAWPREPGYQGRKLSSWLRDFEAEQLEKRAIAADAVKHIGPRAVPFLVRLLEVPNPARRYNSRYERWKRACAEWLSGHTKMKVAVGRPRDLRRIGLAGLDALGPEAKDALPTLEKLIRSKPPDPGALYVVARIGPAGMPLLNAALTNEEHVIRLEARVCLEMVRTHAELLYGDFTTGTNAACFDRRICEFNLKILRGSFEDYRAQHPDQGFPRLDERPPASLPPGFLENLQKIRREVGPRTTNGAGRVAPPSGLE